MYPTVVVLSAQEESAEKILISIGENQAHNSPCSILDALSLQHMHFDLHKDEKQKEEKKETFLIIINDQSGGSIQK